MNLPVFHYDAGSEQPALSRKLTVILHADVVGSTTLVQRNESLAHVRMQDAFRQFSDINEAYGGITHELRGDALVAEFTRGSDAVAASIAFQIHNRSYNATLTDDICPQLRIGISLGEVVIADGTITGTGVVLAQRLEQLAEAGGIVVQAAIVETVPTRLPFNFEYLGERMLKGFDQPLRASAVKLIEGHEVPAPEAGVIPRVAKSEAAGAVDKPSIAVLPFTNMSNDPEQEYFADGIAEDIITALSHIRQWCVISRNSSFAYKGRLVDIREIARELGVRYVLEGSVRKGGNRLRITGQLIEAETGTHIWADRFDGEFADVFALQDRITESVVGAIEPSLRMAEIARARRKPPHDIGAYDLLLQALPSIYTIRPGPNEKALTLLHKAIKLDPEYAQALAYLAWGYEERLTRDWGAYGEDDTGMAVELAHGAIAAGRDDAMVLGLAGFVLVMIARDYAQGLQATKRARELNPNIAFVFLLVGISLAMSGEPEESIICFEKALRLSPGDPGVFIFYTAAALSHLMCGRPAQACDLATRSARIYTEWDTTYRVLASANAQLGRMGEARCAVTKLMELSPAVTVSRLRELWPIRNKKTLDQILDGLRIAGLPE